MNSLDECADDVAASATGDAHNADEAASMPTTSTITSVTGSAKPGTLLGQALPGTWASYFAPSAVICELPHLYTTLGCISLNQPWLQCFDG
jgi:hypothetical protein